MKKTLGDSLPETLQGLGIFLEECRKEMNRINKLSMIATERYKVKNEGKEYVYHSRNSDGNK